MPGVRPDLADPLPARAGRRPVAVTPALWLPGGPFLDSAEVYALDDIHPTPDPPTDPWSTT